MVSWLKIVVNTITCRTWHLEYCFYNLGLKSNIKALAKTFLFIFVFKCLKLIVAHKGLGARSIFNADWLLTGFIQFGFVSFIGYALWRCVTRQPLRTTTQNLYHYQWRHIYASNNNFHCYISMGRDIQVFFLIQQDF